MTEQQATATTTERQGLDKVDDMVRAWMDAQPKDCAEFVPRDTGSEVVDWAANKNLKKVDYYMDEVK
jgi:hypothetical protein